MRHFTRFTPKKLFDPECLKQVTQKSALNRILSDFNAAHISIL